MKRAGPLHFGLLGRNIAYTRSPELFRRIFARDSVAGEFTLYDCATHEVGDAMTRAGRSGVSGLCVTVPHKETAVACVTALDPVAETIGAVNCILITGAEASGYNTDWLGVRFALQAERKRLVGKRAVLIGAGGAARAVAYALLREFDMERVTCVVRDVAQARVRVERLSASLSRGEISVSPLAEVERLLTRGEGVAALVNCTPIGGPNHNMETTPGIDALLGHARFYFDLNYNADNPMIQRARAAGCVVADGFPMLVSQAVESYRIWTGREVSAQGLLDDFVGSPEAPPK